MILNWALKFVSFEQKMKLKCIESVLPSPFMVYLFLHGMWWVVGVLFLFSHFVLWTVPLFGDLLLRTPLWLDVIDWLTLFVRDLYTFLRLFLLFGSLSFIEGSFSICVIYEARYGQRLLYTSTACTLFALWIFVYIGGCVHICLCWEYWVWPIATKEAGHWWACPFAILYICAVLYFSLLFVYYSYPPLLLTVRGYYYHYWWTLFNWIITQCNDGSSVHFYIDDFTPAWL